MCCALLPPVLSAPHSILSPRLLSSLACSLVNLLSHIILICVRHCPHIFAYRYLSDNRKLNWKPSLAWTLFFEAIK